MISISTMVSKKLVIFQFLLENLLKNKFLWIKSFLNPKFVWTIIFLTNNIFTLDLFGPKILIQTKYLTYQPDIILLNLNLNATKNKEQPGITTKLFLMFFVQHVLFFLVVKVVVDILVVVII